ncbi:MAG: hypothetical protein GY820_04535 [Gammaproteobacteria bacterium]|nr:hypothetical protein [Gammaproteobacteria bacterium]
MTIQKDSRHASRHRLFQGVSGADDSNSSTTTTTMTTAAKGTNNGTDGSTAPLPGGNPNTLGHFLSWGLMGGGGLSRGRNLRYLCTCPANGRLFGL